MQCEHCIFIFIFFFFLVGNWGVTLKVYIFFPSFHFLISFLRLYMHILYSLFICELTFWKFWKFLFSLYSTVPISTTEGINMLYVFVDIKIDTSLFVACIVKHEDQWRSIYSNNRNGFFSPLRCHRINNFDKWGEVSKVDTIRHNFEAGKSLALVSTIQFVAALQVSACQYFLL